MPITINDRRFKHFNQQQVDQVLSAGPEGSPRELEKLLGVDARRISELQSWLGLKAIDISVDEHQIILENIHLPIEDIAVLCGKNSDTVMWHIKKNKLRPRLKGNTKRPQEKDSEYEADLANPCLSHAALARKWEVTPCAIGHARKARGLGVWRTNKGTLLEKDIETILNNLDIAYLNQKKIDVWSIDFYLGNKICLDINGTWAHSKPEVIERDNRKRIFLEQNGYKYLAIAEEELASDPIEVANRIKEHFWVSLCRDA